MRSAFCMLNKKCLLFLVAVAVAVHEFVDAAGGVYQFRLTGIEGVRGVGDFKFYQRVGLTVNLDCLFGCDR